MSARPSLIALAVLGCLSASAQAQYTIKLGGAHIDPHATSEPLRGGVSARPLAGALQLRDGASLQVQPQGTVVLAIERALSERWSVEFVLGAPPKHDVKLKVDNAQIDASGVTAGALPISTGAAQVAATNGLKAKLAAQNGQVISTVRQWAPTVFFNYKFLDAGAPLRPFVGVGINVTRFKARTTSAGDTLYADGAKPEISLSDSIGPAVQVGASYKLNAQWSLNASVATARVENKLTIVTRSGLRQESAFRFNPTALTATVGYTF